MTVFLRHLFHYGAYLLGAAVIVVCATALALRFVIMPDIDRYKPAIEAAATRAVGLPVKIAGIKADWWHLNPRFSLRGVTLNPPGRPAALTLGQVDATLSWLSLALLEPRLARLDLHQSHLEIRRDRQGAVFVAGIPVSGPGAPSPFPDWLLRQQTLTVSDGRLTWIDEARGAPPLVMTDVNLLVRNGFGRHRFGLTAQPPASAGRHLDLRGDFHGDSVHDPASWSGRLYLAARGASAAGLNTWSPWAQTAVRRSTGDLRLWMTLARGQLAGVVGDVRLADVAVSLADELPDMTFARISGRLGWHRQGQEQVYSVERLDFATTEGPAAEPATVKVTLRPSPDGHIEQAKVEAASLRLEALTAVSGAVPMPRLAHDWIARLNPRGFVEHLVFEWLGKSRFSLKTRFREGGINESGRLPGFSGLSGSIDTDQQAGQAILSGRNLRFLHDAVFRQPLIFARLESALRWRTEPGAGTRVDLERFELGNADLDGTAEGHLLLAPERAPVIDLRARLARGQGNAVWRYLPRVISDDAYAWLKAGLLGGVSNDTQLVLRGPLDRFPFDQGGGHFQVNIPIRDASLAYAPGWPIITGINGLLSFQGKGMHLSADTGDILGVKLSRVKGIIPDLHYSYFETLTIDGEARGTTRDFLAFVRQSPVHAHTGGFTETLSATGDASLRLRLRLPLRHIHDTQVVGQLGLLGNDLSLGGRLPDLTQVQGQLAFTETWLRGERIAARLHGQPILLGLASEPGGRVRASLQGTLSAQTLAPWLPAALAVRVTGSTPVRAVVGVKPDDLSFDIESDLHGLAIDLPVPLGKRAEQRIATRVQGSDSPDQPLQLSFSHGPQLQGRVARDASGQSRVAVALGGQAATLPKTPGLTVSGRLARLDLDAWRQVGESFGTSTGQAPLKVLEVQLAVDEFKAFRRTLRDLRLQARPKGPAWWLQLASPQLTGEVEYGPRAGQPGQRFQGRFETLAIPEEDAGTAPAGVGETDLGELPAEIALNARAFNYHGRELGELALNLNVEKTGLRVDTLRLANDDSQLQGGGWISASPLRETWLDLKLTAPNLGRLMKRLRTTEAIKGGELQMEGRLNWLGRPEDFALARLGGRLRLDIARGRFTQLDPGAGKLLGILSLQALPRRIALDFRDVFSEGFAFDEIKGDLHLDRGVAYLPALAINGPAAKIVMNGRIGLAQENQDLRLRIQPRLDEGVAVGAALLGGPAVGVGALVASKLLQDPIAKAASFEYLVTGSWDEPVVRKLPRTPLEPVQSGP